jgi:molybdopterin synthase catalytic subunit
LPVRIQAEDFDVGRELERLTAADAKAGAVACFVGLVRDLNDATEVRTLTLEHYPGMTEKALAQIIDEARSRWKIHDAIIIHRIGKLEPGERIVLAAVSGSHRGEAFAACEFIMDYLKTRAPFWKKEQTPSGERWVEARASDEEKASRW